MYVRVCCVYEALGFAKNLYKRVHVSVGAFRWPVLSFLSLALFQRTATVRSFVCIYARSLATTAMAGWLAGGFFPRTAHSVSKLNLLAPRRSFGRQHSCHSYFPIREQFIHSRTRRRVFGLSRSVFTTYYIRPRVLPNANNP